jgi:putative nucleotidyltransferase with HDIG domain
LIAARFCFNNALGDRIPPAKSTIIMTTQKNYGVSEIAELFPSLMKIQDESLREKVAAVWNEAITTGCGGKGWTFDELRAVKFTLLAGDIDMKFVEHLNSCALQCIAIADVLEKSFRCNIPVQRDYLIAGALLADVGKPLEYDKDASGKVVQGTFGQQLRHPFSGVALAYKHGSPGEVMHMIASHSHEGDKVERSIESIIFHHADFVDFDIAKVLGKRAAKK